MIPDVPDDVIADAWLSLSAVAICHTDSSICGMRTALGETQCKALGRCSDATASQRRRLAVWSDRKWDIALVVCGSEKRGLPSKDRR